jgi:hypothetical protein
MGRAWTSSSLYTPQMWRDMSVGEALPLSDATLPLAPGKSPSGPPDGSNSKTGRMGRFRGKRACIAETCAGRSLRAGFKENQEWRFRCSRRLVRQLKSAFPAAKHPSQRPCNGFCFKALNIMVDRLVIGWNCWIMLVN